MNTSPRTYTAAELNLLKSEEKRLWSALKALVDGAPEEDAARKEALAASSSYGMAVTEHNIAVGRAAKSAASRYTDGDERALGCGGDRA